MRYLISIIGQQDITVCLQDLAISTETLGYKSIQLVFINEKQPLTKKISILL